MNNEYYTIGYVQRTVGLKGEFAIRLDVDEPKRYMGIDALFLQDETENIPLFLTSSRVNGTEMVVKPEGVDSQEEARRCVGKTVCLPMAALPDIGEKRFYFHEIKGFEVIDERCGAIGIVEGVIERMMQPVLQVLDGRIEILLPLPEGAVQKVDRVDRKLYVQSPEGLIELYRNPGTDEEEEWRQEDFDSED
jgi:16S rRNA processing protein RimM